jgi:arylsulfatase A-like enzyme
MEDDIDTCKMRNRDIFPGLVTPKKCRQQYHSMMYFLDEIIGNLTAQLKAKGLWENTLLVFTSDNGGPFDLGKGAATNFPLRGAKNTPLEGGIRAAAFLSGGFIPENLRGTVQNGMIHIADWYATLAKLAGVDPEDIEAVDSFPPRPPIDGVDIIPLILGNIPPENSPRYEIPLT